MAEAKRNRWVLKIFLGLSILAFVGFSIFPLISGFFDPSTQATTAPSPNASAAATNPGAKKEELQKQAAGYEAVLQREPENQTALRGLVEAKLALEDLKGAIAPLEKLAKLNSNEPDYMALLAQVKQRSGDAEGAVQTYRTVLAKNPGTLTALDGLVNVLLEQKKADQAITLLQDTLKTASANNANQPGSIDLTSVKLLLGKVYAEEKRYDDAIATYDEAAKIDAKDFRPVLAKALIFKVQNKSDEAKKLFDQAKTLAPKEYQDRIGLMAAAPVPGSSPSAAPGASANPAPAASSEKPAEKSSEKPTEKPVEPTSNVAPEPAPEAPKN